MPRYVTFSPDAKVRGQVVAGFLECVSYKTIAPYLMRHGLLGRHGLQTVDHDQWYDLQDWLNILHDLEVELPDASGHQISIGIGMFDTMHFPPDFNTMTPEEALSEWGSLYSATHRGSSIGEIYTEILDSGQIEIITRVPYPDGIHFGLFYALLNKLCPPDKDFIIEYDESVPRRDHGGNHTAYRVTLRSKYSTHPDHQLDHVDNGALMVEIPAQVNEALIKNRILNDAEVSFRVNGRTVYGSMSLRPSFGRSYQSSGSIAVINLNSGEGDFQAASPLRPSVINPVNLNARSAAMRPVIRQAQVAAQALAPVMITGESGTGKVFLARQIHQESPRFNKPLITVNCRAVPAQHIAHEILGSDAALNNGHPSQFEIAHQGTLLFTHIDSLPLQLQETLLYVIENRKVVRLGDTLHVPVNVRIMATTDQNLEQMVAQGKFLPELYYRFKIFQLHLPALRHRKDDIAPLVHGLLERISQKRQIKTATIVDQQVMDLFHWYQWPGNIREMESVLEFAANQQPDEMIELIHLPDFVQDGGLAIQGEGMNGPVLTLDEAIRKAILRVGWLYEGRVTDMADQLGISRTTLWRYMKQYEISADYFKSQQYPELRK